MQFIYDFFNSIGNVVETIGGFFADIVVNFIQFFKYIGFAAGLSYNLVASLPTWLGGFGLATVLISVIYLIIGRDTGGNKSD